MRPVVFVVSVIVISATLFSRTNGHGMLLDPPSRNSVMNLKIKTSNVDICQNGKTNYNHMAMFCGGRGTQTVNGGLCSACGENVKMRYPRPHDYTGIYAEKITPARVYLQGQVIKVKVDLTAPHKGKFQFRICNVLESKEKNDALTECFNNDADPNNYRLLLKDGRDTYTNNNFKAVESEDIMTGARAPDKNGTARGIHWIHLKLPSGLTCTAGCSFQWRYITGNNPGPDETQEHFVNCADIIIASCQDYHNNRLSPYCGYGPTKCLKNCNEQQTDTDCDDGTDNAASNGETQQQTGGEDWQDQGQDWQDNTGTSDTDCDDDTDYVTSNGGNQQQMPSNGNSDNSYSGQYGMSGQDSSMSSAGSSICDECEGLTYCQHDVCEQTYVGNTNTIDSFCAINCNKSPPVCPSEFCRLAWVPRKNYRQLRVLSLLQELLQKGSLDGRDVGTKPYRK